MGASLSLVALIDYFTRRDFLAAGLRPHSVTLPYPYDGGDGKSSSTCTVHYWAPPGEPKLPPLLLIHGFGPWATWQWRCQVGPLSRQFHIIVPDLLGFGGSSWDCPTVPPPSEVTQAAALAALLDSVEGLEGMRVAVAGTSYGGFVAYWLARAAGAGRVGPVVIASSNVLKTGADDREVLKRAGEEWGRVDDLLLPAEPAAMRRLMQMVAHRPPPAIMSLDFVLRDFIQKLYTNREQLSHVYKGVTVGTDKFQVTPLSQEVLIVWGEDDQLFPVEKAFAVQSALGGKARVEIMKETGHTPQTEDPARFNHIVLDFLLAADKHTKPSINGSSL
ncbi:2-hydroxy-6-oxononadienedioate/2-hydroxy-6-oxononatrienedioate hydrolase-like [Lolium rigidum]|uniref:2-hydroxy-6-oxononadienedioate/2-hydroxy-6- oxononatrienedioate hydrolase-like n=1 Tax=Lolium rigidum TaxID=89674 RepID=UPI001F5DC50D|nr:2-hydroxy-6-oxononadienedioate/2-hydroxy-6-oxononatrienedioate hydrolase-like [Lolium rigidum]